MLIKTGFDDESVALPDVHFQDEGSMSVEIISHYDPSEAPMLVEMHPPNGPVPPPPPSEAPMVEDIWLYDEPVDSPHIEPPDEAPLVVLLDEPVEPPHVEPRNEAQDFDAIVSAIASRHLSEVQLTFSWWRMHHGTEHSRNRLTEYLIEVVENEDIDILDYLLHQGVPFELLQIEIAIQKKSIPMLDIFLRHGWDINEPESWTTPPWLRYLERVHNTYNLLTTAYLG